MQVEYRRDAVGDQHFYVAVDVIPVVITPEAAAFQIDIQPAIFVEGDTYGVDVPLQHGVYTGFGVRPVKNARIQATILRA